MQVIFQRNYTSCMNLKDDDQVIAAFIEDKKNLFLVTDSGYGLAFPSEEVPIVGVNTKLKSMDANGNFVLENVDYLKGKAVISFSYRYLSGQAEPRIENLGSNTQASFKFNVPCRMDLTSVPQSSIPASISSSTKYSW